MSPQNGIDGFYSKEKTFTIGKNHRTVPFPSPPRLPRHSKKLLISGQGSLVFDIPHVANRPNVFQIAFRSKQGAEVQLVIDTVTAYFRYRHQRADRWKRFELVNTDDAIAPAMDGYGSALDLDLNCRYWVSLDSQNKRLRYGKGEMRRSAMLLDYQYDLPKNLFQQKVNAEYSFISDLKIVECSEGIRPLRLWKDPVVTEPPMFVVPSKEFSMDAAARGMYITPNSLSVECQKLYGNIVDFDLSTPDFPDFAQAIEYSLRTEGCIGYEILKKKLTECKFNSDDSKAAGDNLVSYQEVYLRITLGYAHGDSPGIPYVLEIWPAGCASPIHHHGHSHAIIKVLRGNIDVDIYRMLPSQYSSHKSLKSVNFQKGDITYLMPEINQYHLLKNRHNNPETCITIQCYAYAKDDNNHYATFDYIGDNELAHFDPISDYDFLAFKAKIKSEWQEYLSRKFWMKPVQEFVKTKD